MKPVATTIALLIATTAPAWSADALKLSECLAIMQGLNALDGHPVVIASGKPNEQVINQPYEFGNAALRLDIAKNLSALGAVQRDAQSAQQKITAEISKGGEIKPGSTENLALDRQLRELLDHPCDVELKRIKAADLKLDRNEIPGSVLAAIDPILDR